MSARLRSGRSWTRVTRTGGVETCGRADVPLSVLTGAGGWRRGEEPVLADERDSDKPVSCAEPGVVSLKFSVAVVAHDDSICFGRDVQDDGIGGTNGSSRNDDDLAAPNCLHASRWHQPSRVDVRGWRRPPRVQVHRGTPSRERRGHEQAVSTRVPHLRGCLGHDTRCCLRPRPGSGRYAWEQLRAERALLVVLGASAVRRWHGRRRPQGQGPRFRRERRSTSLSMSTRPLTVLRAVTCQDAVHVVSVLELKSPVVLGNCLRVHQSELRPTWRSPDVPEAGPGRPPRPECPRHGRCH